MKYPTQEFVKKMIQDGIWKDEILDIRSLDQKRIAIIELYNQEEIIKQLTLLNEKLTPTKRTVKTPAKPPDKKV